MTNRGIALGTFCSRERYLNHSATAPQNTQNTSLLRLIQAIHHHSLLRLIRVKKTSALRRIQGVYVIIKTDPGNTINGISHHQEGCRKSFIKKQQNIFQEILHN